MKNFEKLNLNIIKNVLSKSEMKMIVAGSGSGCAVQWTPGTGNVDFDFSQSPNTVTLAVDENAGTTTFTGLTYNQAQSLLGNGGRWCCDSCDTASWL